MVMCHPVDTKFQKRSCVYGRCFRRPTHYEVQRCDKLGYIRDLGSLGEIFPSLNIITQDR